MKISFLCFDVSDNSFSRAALLAEALSKRHSVELIGPARRGSIWPPLKDLNLTVKLFPWKRYPQFLSVIRDILDAVEGDVIFACKLRPTSFGIGLLANKNLPLLVDIDDWELGFFYRDRTWSRLGKFLNLSNPNGLPYTWVMERLVHRADAITVSNRFLQKRFGGELLYHCRDTAQLDPKKYDSLEAKKKLGLEHKKLLMFLGTPRLHKGIDDLALVMESIKRPDVHLAIIGPNPEEVSAGELWTRPNKKISLFPSVPFTKIGEYLAAADIVVVPQRLTNDTGGQIPAKIFDAMTMAKPIISTRVSDIPEVLGDCGYLVEPGNVPQLVAAIDHILTHEDEARRKGEMARERCRNLYDIKGLETRLLSLVENAAKKKGIA